MLMKIIEGFIGTKSERDLKKFQPKIDLINALEPEFKALTDEELKAKTDEFRARLEDGETLDDILPEAFAAVREAAFRAIGLRPYDVQMMGGMVLHSGRIAEMRTGEGKTLVATLPVYLNAISGKGVHVVTVNDYLARRDSQWMGPVYRFLGLTVGCISNDMPNHERVENYRRDITYVTNNEVGFDYLRDNMVIRREDRVLRQLNYAVIDEVDSILVDEARTPLIISGPAEESTEKYHLVNRIIPSLKVRFVTDKEEVEAKYSGADLTTGFDAIVDEKAHSVTLTDEGVAKAEKFLGVTNIYDDVQGEWIHHITQALRAHHLYKLDTAYVVKEGEIIIVDEFTGRLMPGRRWSDGLHQAVEAKENLRIKEENQTLATITFQNFFKLYGKASGMTGTAMTEADELWEIYKLEVVEIPTNKPCVRVDHPDAVYRTEREKINAIIADIEDCWKRGQPVLVGTRSIDKSEKLSNHLRARGIPHKVLNAKYHEMEAEIIAQAGRKGAVTIATNMAGRGTDIVLGGNPQVEGEAEHVGREGGLHVLGSERHESRRIDNQLRGRCARQGDPGSTRFYLALDDELMRLFGSDRISGIMEWAGMEEGEAIESRLISRQIESAQRRVESHNFDIRKRLLDYDKVMNRQRSAIYALRNSILDGNDESERISQMLGEVIADSFAKWAPEGEYAAAWDHESFGAFYLRTFGLAVDLNSDENMKLSRPALIEAVTGRVTEMHQARIAAFAEQGVDFKEIERMLLLQLLDQAWKNHLYELDHLQKSVGLRAYGQKDPLIEYQKESFALYSAMLDRVRDQVVDYLFKIQLPPRRVEPPPMRRPENRLAQDNTLSPRHSPAPLMRPEPEQVDYKKRIGRNDPCPCGSGKKFKKCCGKNA
ncbi:MAG: preprotein translocase subunit SecA [Elusimicrobiaceae bacterium]|nr:preprotein translocase subunit SecA [Elusimicrobiaceae bacterium]